MENSHLPPVPSFRDSLVSGVIATLTIFINLIQIRILHKNLKKRVYEKFLLSLSICTLLSGILGFFTMSFTCIGSIKVHFYTIWAIWGVIAAYLSLVSTKHLILITIDRVWAVVSPLHHRTQANRRKTNFVLIYTWIIPLLILSGYILGIQSRDLTINKIIQYNRRILSSAVAVFVLFADLVFLVCYSMIAISIFKNRQCVTSRRQPHMMRILFLCVSFVLVFVICTTPFVISTISEWNKAVWLDKVSLGIVLLKGILDPMIYLIHKGCRPLCMIRKTARNIREERSSVDARRELNNNLRTTVDALGIYLDVAKIHKFGNQKSNSSVTLVNAPGTHIEASRTYIIASGTPLDNSEAMLDTLDTHLENQGNHVDVLKPGMDVAGNQIDSSNTYADTTKSQVMDVIRKYGKCK